jgi:AraC-like DNA-binding protein
MLRQAPHREWIATGAVPLLVKDLRLPRFPWQWHLHAELELTLILAGAGRRLVGDTVQPFAAGDCVLLGPDLPHCWVSGDHAGPARAIVVQFSPDLAGAAARPMLRSLAARAGGGLLLDGRIGQQAVEALPAIVRARHPIDRLGRTLSLLAWIAESEAQPLGGGPGRPAPASDPVLGPALARVQADLDGTITQAGCARLCGLAPAAFARACRRRLGTTFREFVASRRLALACRLLAGSDRPVLEVALQAGFANLSNFNRRFLRQLGMTPTVYRRRARGEASIPD